MKSEAFFLVNKGDANQAFDLRPFEFQDPKGQEVLIEVEAFGLNYADVMARRGLYREAPPMPCVVGYEVVGTVHSVGSSANQGLLGKRVIAFCRFGGYAKHVVTDDFAVVEVADQPAAELLALCTQAVTAYYMADYLAPIHKTDTVLVHAAAGGVGTILIQLAKLKGAKVIAKVGHSDKEELVKKLGADVVVNYRTSDYALQVAQAIDGERIDVIFNPVAGSTFKKDMALLSSGGRMVLFGASELLRGKWGFFSKLNFIRKMGLILPIGLMMRSKNILGVNMLKLADNRPETMSICLRNVVSLYSAGKITPYVGGVYSAGQLAEAHAALEGGRTKGKLCVNW